MMSWLTKLLTGSKQEQTPVRHPIAAIGDKWVLLPREGDPWEQKPYFPVTVIGVCNGWVRYDMGNHGSLTLFRDERMKIEHFTAIYRLVSRNENAKERIKYD